MFTFRYKQLINNKDYEDECDIRPIISSRSRVKIYKNVPLKKTQKKKIKKNLFSGFYSLFFFRVFYL